MSISTIITSAQRVIDRWERGDLAEAVRGLDGALDAFYRATGTERPDTLRGLALAGDTHARALSRALRDLMRSMGDEPGDEPGQREAWNAAADALVEWARWTEDGRVDDHAARRHVVVFETAGAVSREAFAEAIQRVLPELTDDLEVRHLAPTGADGVVVVADSRGWRDRGDS